jgi:hypothetical protein
MLRPLCILPLKRCWSIVVLGSLVSIALALPTQAAERDRARIPPAAKLQVPLPTRQKPPDQQRGRDWSGSYGGIILGAPLKEPDSHLP